MGISDKKGSLTLRFAALSGGYYIMASTFANFFSNFLYDFGYRESFIGVQASIQAIASLGFSLLSGVLLDKSAKYKQILLAGGVLFSAMVPLFFWLGPTSPAFVLLFSVVGMAPVGVLVMAIDSWVLKLRRQGYEIEYPKIRATGSFSHAIFSAVLGRVLASLGNWVAGAAILCGCAFCCIVAWKLPNPEKAPTAKRDGVTKQALYTMLGNRSFRVLLLCVFLANIANVSSFTYFPIRIRDMGGDSSIIGYTILALSISEFLVIYNFDRLRKYLSVATLFGLGLFGFFLRSAALALVPTLPAFVLAGLTQGLSFAPYSAGLALYIGERYEEHLMARYMTVSSAVVSMSGILLNPVCGWVAETRGVPFMMLAFGLTAVAASMIFFWYDRKPSAKAA